MVQVSAGSEVRCGGRKDPPRPFCAPYGVLRTRVELRTLPQPLQHAMKYAKREHAQPYSSVCVLHALMPSTVGEQVS
jgi:hypothetical protein